MSRSDRGTRSQRVQRLVDIAAAQERRLAAAFGEMNVELQSRRSQLGELHAYRQGYSTASSQGPSAQSAHWKDYQNFRARLDRAVAAQQQLVHAAEEAAGKARQSWVKQRRRLESLKKVGERLSAEEELKRNRIEQKQQDEAAPSATAFPVEYGGSE